MVSTIIFFGVPCLIGYLYGIAQITLLQVDGISDSPGDDANKTSPVKSAIGNAMIRVMVLVVIFWGMILLEAVNWGGEILDKAFVLWAVALYSAWFVGRAHGRHLRKKQAQDSNRHPAPH